MQDTQEVGWEPWSADEEVQKPTTLKTQWLDIKQRNKPMRRTLISVGFVVRRPKTHIAESECEKQRPDAKFMWRQQMTHKVRRQGVEAPERTQKIVPQMWHKTLTWYYKRSGVKEVIRAYSSYLHREIRVQKAWTIISHRFSFSLGRILKQ